MKFNELQLSDEVLRSVEEMGFEELTEIQARSIPLIQSGSDVIGKSNTGTGKTAAFGIPAIESISRERKGVEVLILCPTRELAMQACEEIKKFSKYMPWVRPSAVYGGASMERQILDLKHGANIVVGTPGRVMDHMRRRTLKLSELKMVILDEADEMLNMGFREDIESILQDVPEERQTILFSATMPPAILAITNQYQKNPELVKVADKHRTVDTIEQYYFDVPSGMKTEAIQYLLLAYEPKASMIFCNTKKMVDELTESLTNKGFKAAGLHGDMKQAQRTFVMDRFKSGKINVLIATDVAARGIDVSGIDVVFNYDLPQDNEYYIHRIGRTGRAGKSGTAYTMVSNRKQIYDLKALSRYIKAEITEKDLPEKSEIIENKKKKVADRIRSVTEIPLKPETEDILAQLESEGLTARQIAGILINLRLNKELRNIPEFEFPKVKKAPAFTGGSGKFQKGNMTKIEISAGRSNKLAPNFILGALVEATNMAGKSFGKIDIYDKYTTVEVPEQDAEYVVTSMDNKKVNGRRVSVKICDRKPADKPKFSRSRDGGFRGSDSQRRGGGASRSGSYQKKRKTSR
ncbi:MAG: DEAD/DEAH box helicase [Oscillospiraceae bacterium]|nr:DEAD/DEAH box helicase [Oscillospiraceae bacterium]